MQRHAENGKSKYFTLEINSCENIRSLYNETQENYAKDIECSDDDADTKKSIIEKTLYHQKFLGAQFNPY